MAKTPSHPLRRKTDKSPVYVLRDYISTLWRYRLAIALTAAGIVVGVALPLALASLYDVRHGPVALAILATGAVFAIALIPLKVTQARARDEAARHQRHLENLHGLTLEALARCNNRTATVLRLLAPDQARDPDAVRVTGTRNEAGAYAPGFEDVARQMIGRRVCWTDLPAMFGEKISGPVRRSYGTVTGSQGLACVVKPDGQPMPVLITPVLLTLLDEFDQPVLGGAFQAERRRNRGQVATDGQIEEAAEAGGGEKPQSADPNYLLRDG